VTAPRGSDRGKSDGQSSILAYAGHVLMENRNGLVRGACLTHADGSAEREAALALLDRHATGKRRSTVGADRGYDVAAFVIALRDRRVTPHIAVDGRVSKTGRRRHSEIDQRPTRWPGYGASQRIRKRIEEVFGWMKSSAGLRQTASSRPGAGRMDLQSDRCRLQSDEATEPPCPAGATAVPSFPVVSSRCWRSAAR
jgi:hypothetical protein